MSVSDRYEKLDRLGEGTYGVVYKARDRQTNKLVALKRCIPHHEARDGFPITTLREIEALRICQSHPHVVSLETVAVSRSGVFLVLEFCEHDLANVIDNYYQRHKKSPFSASQVKTLTSHLLQAVAFLHERHWIHRDLKVSNLLYHQGVLKVADYGLARSVPDYSMTFEVASLWYRPPELLLCRSFSYSTALDIWAVGCIIAEFRRGKPLFSGKTELEQIDLIGKLLGGFPANLPVDDGIRLPPRGPMLILDEFPAIETTFLLMLLQIDPNKRCSAKEALDDRYWTQEPTPCPIQGMPKFRS